MFPDRAPMWMVATASAIVALAASARPLLGGGGGLPFNGQQNPPSPRPRRTTVRPVTAG